MKSRITNSEISAFLTFIVSLAICVATDGDDMAVGALIVSTLWYLIAGIEEDK